MIDGFVIFTPILLLVIVALLGFAGCQFTPGAAPSGVSHVQTVVQSAAAGTKSVTAAALSLQGGELIIAAVQWGSAVALPETPTLSGAPFSPVNGGGPFAWNAMSVQIFSALNPASNTQLTVTASLPRNSDVTWNLCVSAYDGADEDAPLYSPQTSPLNYVGSNPQTPPLNIGTGDLVYAVAFAANSDGTFPGNNSLTGVPGFTAEFPAITDPLVEDGNGTNPVVAQVTNTNPDPTAKGFIFAMGLKSAG
ncbi:MAG: hypothetical protein ABSE85_11160 [Candidatus Korobacteraceae bacterium]|jgi:hypothetical protein